MLAKKQYKLDRRVGVKIMIIFFDPLGEHHKNPRHIWMRKKVLECDDEFWDVEAGAALLTFYEKEKRKADLEIKGIQAYGYKINYKSDEDMEPPQVLTTGVDTGKVVEVEVGGNPFLCRREYFVPKEIAWEVIEYFMQTGKRKDILQWERYRSPDSEEE